MRGFFYAPLPKGMSDYLHISDDPASLVERQEILDLIRQSPYHFLLEHAVFTQRGRINLSGTARALGVRPTDVERYLCALARQLGAPPPNKRHEEPTEWPNLYRRCRWCDKPYTAKQKIQRYCCHQCKYHARPKPKIIQRPKSCPACHKTYLPTKSNQIYCCVPCCQRACKGHQKACDCCGMVYWPRSSSQRYCCSQCSRTITCKSCGQKGIASSRRVRECAQCCKKSNRVTN